MSKRRVKLKFKKKSLVIIIPVILVLVIVILFMIKINEKKKEKPIPTNEPKQEEVAKPEENEDISVIDLNSDSRNIAVMINNIKDVWGYQTGVQEAHIVYEIIVEGGFTRLMAIYKDKDISKLGSIRSARPYYLDYVLENDAIYVHFGGSDQALQEVKTLGINNINFLYDSGYYRDKSLNLASEHTAYTSTDRIDTQIKKKKYRTTTESDNLLDYSVESIDLQSMDEVKVANKVYIQYSGNRDTSFEYDSENKVYKRYQNDEAHIDYETKEQYTAKNIITYQIKNYSVDSYGRQAIENIGSGEGYLISEGYAVAITWEKKSRNEQTVYKFKNGEEIKVNDGNTYIQIQPKGRKFTIE